MSEGKVGITGNGFPQKISDVRQLRSTGREGKIYDLASLNSIRVKADFHLKHPTDEAATIPKSSAKNTCPFSPSSFPSGAGGGRTRPRPRPRAAANGAGADNCRALLQGDPFSPTPLLPLFVKKEEFPPKRGHSRPRGVAPISHTEQTAGNKAPVKPVPRRRCAKCGSRFQKHVSYLQGVAGSFGHRTTPATIRN